MSTAAISRPLNALGAEKSELKFEIEYTARTDRSLVANMPLA